MSTELNKIKYEDINKTRNEDSRKGNDSSNTAISKNIDQTGSPKRNSKFNKKGKRVSFNKNIADTVIVESYKRFNLEMSYDETGGKAETIKCKCLIF